MPLLAPLSHQSLLLPERAPFHLKISGLSCLMKFSWNINIALFHLVTTLMLCCLTRNQISPFTGRIVAPFHLLQGVIHDLSLSTSNHLQLLFPHHTVLQLHGFHVRYVGNRITRPLTVITVWTTRIKDVILPLN